MIGIQLRTYYSIQHLKSAYILSEDSKSVEIQFNSTIEDREKLLLISRNNAYATTSILSSLSFLEAVINEVICDIVENIDRVSSLPLSERNIIKDKWLNDKLDWYPLIKKYNSILKILNLNVIEKSSEIYQNIEILVQLRNTLIHFKPEWNSTHSPHISEFENQHQLTDKLIGKFAYSTFYKDSGNPFFPDKCIGYGCSNWAIRNVLAFSDEFHEKIGLKPIYDHIRNEIVL